MPNVIQRIKAAGNAFWKPQNITFGPGEPIRPQAPNEPIRREDYQVGRNMLVSPRSTEARAVSYDQMRALARTDGILRTVIEKRKDEVKGLEWGIAPRADFANEDLKDEIKSVTRFFDKPDKEHTFDQWQGTLLEDLYVIDAMSIYREKDMAGQLHSLQVVDGATILILVNDEGRVPKPPQPAYEQIIKGYPYTWWTQNELIYHPYNVASDGLYGFSHVESIIMTINIALRRQTTFLKWFTDGNIPSALANAPEGWSAEQISQFQMLFDTMLSGDLAARSGLRFIPGTGPVQMLQQLTFDGLFDEWLARIYCARFGVSPAAYVRMMNRATAETMEESTNEEALIPVMQHLKAMYDRIIEEDLGFPQLEFVWTSGQLHYTPQDAQTDNTMLERGVMTIDDVRKRRGMPPLANGQGSQQLIWTGSGPVLLEDILSGAYQAQQQGQGLFNQGGDNLPRLSIGQNGGDQTPIDEELDTSDYELSIRAMKTELDAWEHFALNRIGKKTARIFETKTIPSAMALEIQGNLLTAADADGIKGVFEVARHNLSRRRTPIVDESLSKLMGEYEGVLKKVMEK